MLDLYTVVQHMQSQGGDERDDRKDTDNKGAGAEERVNLVVQYFESGDAPTQAAQALALRRNLANSHIHRIHVLSEAPLNLSKLLALVMPNSESPSDREALMARLVEKVEQHVLGQRLTFRMALLFANEYLIEQLVIIGKQLYSIHSQTMYPLMNLSLPTTQRTLISTSTRRCSWFGVLGIDCL